MNTYTSLLWLNFFVADVQDGLGPYLGVFLQSHGFKEGSIGAISTIASLVALLFGVPLGILVDKTNYKRVLIAACICLIIFVTSINYFYTHFIFTLIAQITTALCATFLAPAFSALTLGIVGIKSYAKQVSKNEAYKHAGTAFGAILSFVFALYYGISSIFAITAIMGIFSLVFLYLIKEDSINHEVARGQVGNNHIPLSIVFRDKNIWILGIVMFCFHLSNAAMLPLLSQRAHNLGIDSSGAYAAMTIIVAQVSMIAISLFCGKILENNNHRIYFYLMMACFIGLIVRGSVAAFSSDIISVIIVQILDGIGAGVSGVIVPILVAIILRGSGHINAGFSFVMICGGIGGAFSGSLGGFVAQYFGYFYVYIVLGSVALLGLIVWILSMQIFQKSLNIFS